MSMALDGANNGDPSIPILNSEADVTMSSEPCDSVEGGLSVGLPKDQEGPLLQQAVSELHNLSTVLQEFKFRWDELQTHLSFIESSIKIKEEEPAQSSQRNSGTVISLTKSKAIPHSKEKLVHSSQPKESKTSFLKAKTKKNPELVMARSGSENPSVSAKETTKSETSTVLLKGCETPTLLAKEKPQSDSDPAVRKQRSEHSTPTVVASGNSSKSNVERLCQSMCGRELRRYVVTHLSQASKLRQELPVALKGAPDPAKVVLESVGKFYLQGSKAYSRNPAVDSSRRAALLILECFLLSDGFEKIGQSEKKEAEQASLAWRKRLVAEGGLFKASDEDARGLLLLIASYGIPCDFTVEDLIHLLRLSTAREISPALRKSFVLVGRMREIIDVMTNLGMEIGAVDTVYTFGIEERFPPQKILASFLRNMKEACREPTDGNDFLLQKEAFEKQLSALKCVLNCLQAHKVDPSKVIPGWKLTEKISNLAKSIADLDKKFTSKRRMVEQDYKVSSDHHPQLKRPRVVGETSRPIDPLFSSLREPRGEISLPIESPFSSLQEQRRKVLMPTDPPFSSLREQKGEISLSINSPFSSLREQRGETSLHRDSPFSSLREQRGETSLHIDSPFSSLREPRGADPLYQLQSRYLDPVNSYPAVSVKSYPGVSVNSHPAVSSWSHEYTSFSHNGAPMASSQRSVDHNIVGPTGPGVPAYGGILSSVEGSSGRTSATDLYNFADSVLEGDFSRGSYQPGSVPYATSSYRTSFL